MIPFDKVFLNSAEVGRHMPVGDAVIHYHEQGEGPALVLLPGLGFSLFTFRYIIAPLSERYRVLSVDLPGCGYSRGLNGTGTLEDMAGTLEQFIDALCPDPVAILGVAEGALYGLLLAQRRPEKVAALALVSPGSLTRHYPWAVQLLLTPWVGEWLVRRATDADLARMLKFFFFDKTTLSEHEIHQFIAPFDDMQTRMNLLTLLRNNNTHPVYEGLGRVACPVLLLWGQYDTGHPVAMSELYTQQIPQCVARVLPNCGMLVHEERPADVLDSVNSFLARHLTPRYLAGLQ